MIMSKGISISMITN